MSEFKALVLSGTLKPKGQFSHTETLAGVLIEEMKKYDIESEIVRLNEYKIPPGVESKEGKNDEWPKILKKILGCHILIFATPIWWGIQSSLIQRAIERMDALNDELLETGQSELANKVGGLVITGAEDGAQHIIGNILNFMVWNGLTMPPACSLSFLGSVPKETEDSYRRKFKKKPTIHGPNHGIETLFFCTSAQGKPNAARYGSDQELHCRGHGRNEGRSKK